MSLNKNEEKELLDFLEHLSSADSGWEDPEQTLKEARSLRPAPAYLKEQILERSQMPDVKLEQSAKATSKQIQLFFYSLKTAAAVGIALLLLSTVSNVDMTAVSQPYPSSAEDTSISRKFGEQIRENNNKVAGYLNQISNYLLRGEK